MEKGKRIRRPNFLPEEVEMLVASLEDRRELVTGELGVGCMKRTITEIKEKWMCLKCRTKKKAQAYLRLDARGSPEGIGGGGGGGNGVKREPLTPMEERVIDLIGKGIVYGLFTGGSQDILTPSNSCLHADEQMLLVPEKLVETTLSHNGDLSVKTEDDSSPEPSSVNPQDEPSTSRRRTGRPTQSLLKEILHRQQLMLDAWAGFQDSIDMHNKIQKGILCMKYMKLKLLADERNLEVVLPPDIESLLTETVDD